MDIKRYCYTRRWEYLYLMLHEIIRIEVEISERRAKQFWGWLQFMSHYDQNESVCIPGRKGIIKFMSCPEHSLPSTLRSRRKENVNASNERKHGNMFHIIETTRRYTKERLCRWKMLSYMKKCGMGRIGCGSLHISYWSV